MPDNELDVDHGRRHVIQNITVAEGFAYGVIGADIHIFSNGLPLYLLANWQDAKSSGEDAAWLRQLPSRMLDARRAVVPFTGRDEELDRLIHWRDGDEARIAVHWLHGPGGQGKTRLTAQLAASSADAGWKVVAAFHGPDADRPEPGSQDLRLGDAPGLLVIVDYADRWALPNLAWFLKNSLIRASTVPVRVLMVARTADAWPRVRGILDSFRAAASSTRLGALPTGSGGRTAMFEAARDSFAAVLGAPASPAVPPPAALDGAEFGLTLAIHLAALVAVDPARDPRQPAPTDINGLTRYVLDREHLHWARSFAPGGGGAGQTFRTPPESMHRLVFIAALTGTMERAEGATLLHRIPGIPDPDRALIDHSACYPASPKTVLEPLYPDRLAEDLLALALAGHGSEDYSAQLWAPSTVQALLSRAADGSAAPYTSRAIVMLASAAQRWPHVGSQVLAPLLTADPQLAVDADSAGLSALAAAPSVEIAVIERIDPLLPESSTDFALDIGIADLSDRLTGHRLENATTDTRRARLEGRHSSRLAAAGRSEEALDASREAVRLWEALAAEYADVPAFERNLAAELGRLAARFATLGQHDEALEADRRAVDIWKRHIDEEPALAPAYAAALHHLAMSLAAVGSHERALSTAHLAVETLRQLDEAEQKEHRALIAAAWDGLGARQAASGRHDQALRSSRRSVELWEAEARTDQNGSLPYLAAARGNLQLRLAEQGRGTEAVEAARRVVEDWRKLTGLNRPVFQTDLAQGLDHLGLGLHRQEQLDEAAAAFSEAAEIYRILAAGNPDAHEERLAGTLDHLAMVDRLRSRLDEALAANREAVELYQRAADRRPDAPRAELAKAVDNQGIMLAQAGRHEEALAAARRGAALLGDLATQDADAYEPDYARALHNLGQRYADLQRSREALESVEQAVGLRRRLAATEPGTFTADLGRSLALFAQICSKTGIEPTRGAALAAAEEACEVYRLLAHGSEDFETYKRAYGAVFAIRAALRRSRLQLSRPPAAAAVPEQTRSRGWRLFAGKKAPAKEQPRRPSSGPSAPAAKIAALAPSPAPSPKLPPDGGSRRPTSQSPAGNPASMNECAIALFNQGDREAALEIWRRLSHEGDAQATANLVIEYAADSLYTEALASWRELGGLGLSVPPADPGIRLRGSGRIRAAEGWWRVAFEELHDDRSCEYLGISLRERGEYDTARHWLLRGAAHGDAGCIRELVGILLLLADQATDAVSRKKLHAEAVTWARRGAAQGDERSQLFLETSGDAGDLEA